MNGRKEDRNGRKEQREGTKGTNGRNGTEGTDDCKGERKEIRTSPPFHSKVFARPKMNGRNDWKERRKEGAIERGKRRK